MKFIDEYRNAKEVKKALTAIHNVVVREWNIMEICGGQTHAFLRYGINELLPKKITLLHGPGCPVCVTPQDKIDKAVYIASLPDTILCSFGDMVRVPGSHKDLLSVKAEGGNVRIVYSPMDALQIAEKNPDKKVVFFAIGFETTAPANAIAVLLAQQKKMKNFSILCSQVLVPPAMEAILSSPDSKVNGFLAAGHVCSVMGYHEYLPIAQKYKTPIVVTGFEPLDLLYGVYNCVLQLENKTYEVNNQYKRSVSRDGNLPAQQTMKKVFRIKDQQWRGIGTIPHSGLGLAKEYSTFDAEEIFKLEKVKTNEPTECLSGLILQGLKKPTDCPHFGSSCTPEKPMGATMVSSEGACAAYYKYKK